MKYLCVLSKNQSPGLVYLSQRGRAEGRENRQEIMRGLGQLDPLFIVHEPAKCMVEPQPASS